MIKFYLQFRCNTLMAQIVKASAYNVGDLGSIPGLGRSPGEGNGNPLQYSCLENPVDGGAQQATVHGVTKSRTRLSNFTRCNNIIYPIYFFKFYQGPTLWQALSCEPENEASVKRKKNQDKSAAPFTLYIIQPVI